MIFGSRTGVLTFTDLAHAIEARDLDGVDALMSDDVVFLLGGSE